MNTRIAPSPTGLFHIGTARTAYHSYLAAKAYGGKFILRIDDTDKERNKEEFVDVIRQGMEWLGLEYDETFRQSTRFDRYEEVLDKFVDAGLARRCDDKTTRLNLPEDTPDLWHDIVGGNVKISKNDKELIGNLVLWRSNDTPTYHFASVVDDFDTEINIVIRGTDHISNTPRQMAIFNGLNKVFGTDRKIKFAHVGLIHKDGKKMSKRDGASNILDYKTQGYHPEAVRNFVLKMGWGHPDANFDKTNPLLPKPKAIEVFPNGKLRAAASKFDINKLDFLNKEYQKV